MWINRPNLNQIQFSRKTVSKINKVADNKIGKHPTHRMSVMELVYDYLERVSDRAVRKNRKTHATNEFRKFHRRNKYSNPKMKPNAPRRRKDEIAGYPIA